MNAIRARRLAAIAWTLAALAGCGGSSSPPAPQCTQASDCAAIPNAAAACVNGSCALGSCNAGFADCDLQLADGCEVDTRTSLASCGGCNQACAPQNATGVCAGGQCGIAACNGTFRDCDASAANGCETDTATSLAHCGACNQACAPQNATGVCAGGQCAIAACTPPFADCDGNPANGCECVLQASHPGITVFNQTVPALDGDGVAFPGQANFWDLDGDFSLRSGGDRQFAGALALKVGALEATAGFFPGDQAFADLTFFLPEFTAADGVKAAAVSGPFTYLGGQARAPISGGFSAWLASTSGSRLSQDVDLTAAATPVTLSWQDAGFASAAAVLPGEGFSYQVVATPAAGAPVVVQPSSAAAWPATARSADISSLAGQRVTITFELRGPAVAMVAVDDVSVAAGGPNLVRNGNFETGDLTGWTVAAPAEPQNVASGPRAVGGLRVTRTVYAPPSALWARWMDLYENTGTADVVTTAWYESALGSGGNGVTYFADGTQGMAVSSWDTCSATPLPPNGCAPGTRDVGLAFGSASGVAFATAPDLSGNNWALSHLVSWHHPLLVPAGGRVALVHFAVMDGADTGTTATSVAARAAAVDAQNLAIATGFWSDAQYRAGMTQAQIDAVANWPRQCAQAADCPAIPHGTPACQGGACVVGACDAGFADCNGFPGDGCEANLATDPAHCNACGTACPAVANGVPGCSAGVCGVGSCSPGFGDCDGLPGNGCEANLAIDVAHCGACATPCAPANATGFCAAGSCGVAACNAGFADCNGLASDGCEVNLATDPANCGLCFLACSIPNGVPACAGGACAVASCDVPYADCNLNPADGCETNTAIDAANCGACGTVCSYPHATASCLSGSCAFAGCLPWWADCNQSLADGCETYTATDLQNCGTCGRACPAVANGTPGCAAGLCGIASCNAGFADCVNGAADGCETSVLTDPQNCGGCGLACSLPNATAGCAGGACTVAACTAPWQNCDGVAANGCESSSLTDPQNCGACGNACPSGVCSAGACLDKVLLVAATSLAGAAANVQAGLAGTGAFAAVDTFDAAAATPALALLQGYQAVLVWSDAPFFDANALGDVLATWFEGGGRVVVAAQANTTTTAGLALGGRFGNPATGYLLVAPAGVDNAAGTLVVVDGTSPLLANVTALSATVAWKSSGATANGGVAAATWSTSGFPLAVSGTVTVGAATRRRADLNLYPPSSAVDPTLWTGDGVALLRNALLYR